MNNLNYILCIFNIMSDNANNIANKDLNNNIEGASSMALTKEMLKKLDPIEEASKQAETIDSPRIRERSAGPPKIPRLNLAAVENIHPFLHKHAY